MLMGNNGCDPLFKMDVIQTLELIQSKGIDFSLIELFTAVDRLSLICLLVACL